MDESSFVQDWIRYARATVVTQDDNIWAQALGAGTSAQGAELLVLTQALHMEEDKAITIYIHN